MPDPPKIDSLPIPVKNLFWDYDAGALRWEDDRELIMARILASGPWDTVRWLRSTAGDRAIRRWIEEHEGRGLSPRQLRFWQVVLEIPEDRVDGWLRSERRGVWDRRTHS